MSLVSTVISDIRVEVNDTASTRFTDDTTSILPLVKQAIRRANRICQRQQLHFAKKKAALVTVAGQNYVDFPADFDLPIALFRDDLHVRIPQINEDEWEQIVSADEMAAWFMDYENSKILLNATPATAVNLSFWYFPKIDPSAYTVASTMPWGGKLDDIVSRYVAMRLQNIEEQDVTVDQAILQDMENSIVTTYAPLNPMQVKMKGWM